MSIGLDAEYQAALQDFPAACPWCGETPWCCQRDDVFHIRCDSYFCPVNPGLCKPTRSGALLAWNQRNPPTE